MRSTNKSEEVKVNKDIAKTKKKVGKKKKKAGGGTNKY